MKPNENTEVLSLAAFSSDGSVWILRRGRRGSMPLKLKDITDIGVEKFWMLDQVPDRTTGVMQELNDAYSQYLFMKDSGFSLMADHWLDTADRLAGRVSEMITRLGSPKVVYIKETKRPAWATSAEDGYSRRLKRKRRTTLIPTQQLALFN